MDIENLEKLEIAAYRRLIKHLQKKTDVQNIDIMDLAGFCRNCLSRWMSEEADKLNITYSKEKAQEYVYGMTYEKWKEDFQK
tara:strand:+ start:216 stop:461 length:246 start_codon:yes stop_codon:yes gene_type:complete